jgi:hypothetical protein
MVGRFYVYNSAVNGFDPSGELAIGATIGLINSGVTGFASIL